MVTTNCVDKSLASLLEIQTGSIEGVSVDLMLCTKAVSKLVRDYNIDAVPCERLNDMVIFQEKPSGLG